MEKTRVGIIGIGGIARGIHIPGYLQSQDSIITAICDIDPAALARGAELCHIPPEYCFRDYRDLIACSEVDIIDICTPNYLHCPIAEEAIRQGKPFSSEKPMGMNYAETMAVMDQAQKAGLPGHVCFTWHYRPYVRFMKWLVDQGAVGSLYHVYVRCIKDSGLWPGRKLEWRFDKTLAGTGVLGDLASHMFDITRFVTGEEFKSVSADLGIYIKQRQKIDSAEIGEVTTDDWCNILARMDSGLNATYQISRCTTNIGDWIGVELYGSNGMLIYNYLDGNQTLEICSGPMDAAGKGRHTLTPPARFNANQSQAFVNLANGVNDGLTASIQDGVVCQRVLDATQLAASTRRWVDIQEIT